MGRALLESVLVTGALAALVGWRVPRRPGALTGGWASGGRTASQRLTASSATLGSRRSNAMSRPTDGGARWARRADLGPLVIDRNEAGGRLVVGRFATSTFRRGGGPGLVAAERAQSVAVVGPTQSGKTSAFAVPAILGWEGPVLAASVKSDLVRATEVWRRRTGRVWVFDPGNSTGLAASDWSPLLAAREWPGARRVAADLCALTRTEGTTADGEFWYAMAAKLLSPLLFAAAASSATMRDVVRWVDTQEVDEVAEVLEALGVPEALQSVRATWLRDERQRSGIYATVETVLEPFAIPMPASGVGTPAVHASHSLDGTLPERVEPFVDPEALLSGANTLYVCAPAHDQRRLRALFVAVVSEVVHTAFTRSSALGRPLDPPLLVVLDEAANIAPLPELDGLAATCAGHGVQMVTVWQDLAQVRARYGERAATVVNNHRAKLFLPGIADPGTLDFASHLAGEEERILPTLSVTSSGERTLTRATSPRRLLPPDALRRLPPGRAVLLYGSVPPVPLVLRPWYADAELARRATGGASPPRTSAWRRILGARGARGRRVRAAP